MLKPKIREFLDFRAFILEWMEYLQSKDSSLSYREIAKRADISNSMLTRLLKKNGRIKERNFDKLLMVLKLAPNDEKYLKHLFTVSESEDPLERRDALKTLKRYKGLKSSEKSKIEEFRYVEGWENAVLREMVSLKGFQNDPQWIAKKLKGKITSAKAKKTMEFLIDNAFVVENKEGRLVLGEADIRKREELFYGSLQEFYKQMFALVSELYEEGDAASRSTECVFFPIRKKDFAELEKILIEAVDKIEKLSAPDGEGEVLYYTAVLAEPIVDLS